VQKGGSLLLEEYTASVFLMEQVNEGVQKEK
jgi:hypothetical protein